MALIYKIANDINDKVYVGQTTRTLNRRISQHLYSSKKNSNSLIHRAIRKYGWKHFQVEILEDDILLKNLNEREIYWTNKFNAISPNGYVLIAGQNNNKIISEETRKNLSDINKKRFIKNHPKNKIILCYDLDNNFIKEFDSISNASKELNLDISHISKVCRNKLNKTGNYKFKYKQYA